MPISFRVQSERRLVEARFSGPVGLDEIVRYMRDLEDAPGYAADFDAIVDVREAVAVIDTTELRLVASHVRARPPEATSRRAVVTGEDAVYGVMRMFEAFVDDAPTRYRVFRSMDDALRWLDLDAAALRHLDVS